MTVRLRRIAGFTLVEVVVALTLVSVIMLGLMTALSTFANTGARLERRALASDDVRLVYAFLQQSLAAASPRAYVREADSVYTVWFQGEAEQIEWLGLMPARHGAGGLYHLRLGLEPGIEGAQLLLRYLPYAGDEAGPEWPEAPVHRLVAEITHFSVAYQRLGAGDWLAQWSDPEVLPGRVRIRLALADSMWPDLVVPVMAADPGVDVEASEPLAMSGGAHGS